MMQIRVQLLGQPAIHYNGNPITELSAKAMEMFCYLLLYRDRPHTRGTLAYTLWTDISASRAQKYLRQTLWQLQTALDRHLKPSEDASQAPLLLDPGWIRVNPRAVWLDIAGLEQAHAHCRETPGAALTAAQVAELEGAVLLYQGDLLATWYQDWCIYERERLQLTYLAILDKLVNASIAQQRYAKGIDYGQRILRCDPAREVTYQQLMRLHYQAGDRTTALRVYERCVRVLAHEFDIAPTARTTALHEQIRADRLADAAAPNEVGEHTQTAPVHTYNTDLRAELAHLRDGLAAYRTELLQGLAAITHMLEDQQKMRRQTRGKTR